MLAYLDVWTFSGWSDNDAKPLGPNVWCETGMDTGMHVGKSGSMLGRRVSPLPTEYDWHGDTP